ncbi:unnamed protein product, partial [Closterium sp. NIES-54]
VGSLPWGNPFLAVMADIMHQADLRMLDHIVVCIRAQHPTMMKILDLRLLRLTLKTRINSLRFPKSEYFKTGAQVAAFEHRSVMQVLIFLVADVVGSPQLEAIRAYLDWYLCCNAASHTERSLSELQAKST